MKDLAALDRARSQVTYWGGTTDKENSMPIWKTLLWEIRIRRGIRIIERLEAERRLPIQFYPSSPHHVWRALLEYTDAGAAIARIPPHKRDHITLRLFARAWHIYHRKHPAARRALTNDAREVIEERVRRGLRR
jgi:hypothetical protein